MSEHQSTPRRPTAVFDYLAAVLECLKQPGSPRPGSGSAPIG